MGTNVNSADFLGVLEPIFTYEYVINFPKSDNKLIKLIKKVSLPTSSVTPSTVTYKNKTKTIAGRTVHHSLSLTLEAFVNPNTAALAWNWYRLVNIRPGVMNTPGMYKEPNGTIQLLNGRSEPVLTWTILGLWPSEVKISEAQEGQSEIFKLAMVLEYDDIEGPVIGHA